MRKMLDFKVPGVGRAVISNPIAIEKSGAGVGRIDALGSQRPRGELDITVFGPDGKPKQTKEYLGFWSRFWDNVRPGSIVYHTGTGLVTDVGVLAMANEYAWANPSGSVNTVLALANWHATGTGTTAAAVTDKKLQTWDSIAAVAGTQSLVASGTAPIYQTVATISYTGTEAVTEWGLHTSGTLSSTTGTPFTAATSTGFTATGTPFTASSSTVAGQQFQVVFPGTTASWGLILSNTTSVATIPAWYANSNDGAGSTPGATEAYTLRPVLFDHKVFSSVSVNNGDSISFTYKLTVQSGG